MFSRIIRLLIIFLLCVFVGINLTHYIERYQDDLFLKIRNIYYFSSNDSREISDGVVYSKYKELDSCYFNPVHHIQSVWEDIYVILSDSLDNKYFKKDKQIGFNKERIIIRANKLMNYVDTLESEGNTCYKLIYDFPESTYNLSSGWCSGMAQGLAAELMVATFCVTKDSMFLKNAECFINFLNVNVENGGVNVLVDGGVWYEEYAQYNVCRKYPLVLNGHVFAIDGLYALTKISNNPIYKTMLSEAINAIEANITKYIVAGYWSRYDLFQKKNVSNRSYHDIHTEQLERLVYLCGENDIGYSKIEMALTQFELGNYLPIGIWIRLFYQHNRMLLLMTFINSVIIFFVCVLLKVILNIKTHD